MKAWLLAARLKTLPAAVAPVVAGTTLGWRLSGAFDFALGVLALAGCLCLQISTNLFNDAIDHRKGADTEARLGPRRVTASGLLSPRQVTWTAIVFLIGAAACATPLFLARGWPIVALGVPSLYFCYGYTGGPAPLAYRGLGEVFVLFFFGWVAVVGSAFVQSGHFHWPAVLLGTQIGLLSTSLIAINNFRDVEEDGRSGKRTLAVRFGQTFARWEIALCLLLPYALGGLWMVLGFGASFFLPMLGFPLAVFVTVKIAHAVPSRACNRFLALSALHLLVFTTCLTIGLAR